MAKGNQANAWGCGLLILILVGMISRCGKDEEIIRSDDPASEISTAMETIYGDAFERESPSGIAADFSEGETAYITANSLNGRASPSTDAPVVTSLPHSSSATIVDRSGEWMKVRSEKGDVWVSSKYVSRYRPAPRPKYTPQPQRYYGSGCPCSGSQVCIGPRGGRYCITSGGNKRYGV